MSLHIHKLYKCIHAGFLSFVFLTSCHSWIQATDTISALFTAYPNLTTTLGYFPLNQSPSPLQNVFSTIYKKNFFLKTEDCSQALTFAQQRRLEFIFGEALHHHAQGIMMVAWPDSTFAYETTLLARALNLICYYLCRPDNDLFMKNQEKMNNLLNAGVFVQTFKTKGSLEKAMHLLNRQFKKEKNIELYFMYEDGECEAGTLGVLNEIFEIKKHINDKEFNQPSSIFFITNNAADVVGLIIGLQACSIKSHIVVINTNTSLQNCFEERVKILFDCTKQYLFEREELFSLLPFPEETVSILSCTTAQGIFERIINHEFFKNNQQTTPLVWNTTPFEIKEFPW